MDTKDTKMALAGISHPGGEPDPAKGRGRQGGVAGAQRGTRGRRQSGNTASEMDIFTKEQKASFRAQDALYVETMQTP